MFWELREKILANYQNIRYNKTYDIIKQVETIERKLVNKKEVKEHRKYKRINQEKNFV